MDNTYKTRDNYLEEDNLEDGALALENALFDDDDHVEMPPPSIAMVTSTRMCCCCSVIVRRQRWIKHLKLRTTNQRRTIWRLEHWLWRMLFLLMVVVLRCHPHLLP
jgi:hypothetical protein